jgi:hypothetical protein
LATYGELAAKVFEDCAGRIIGKAWVVGVGRCAGLGNDALETDVPLFNDAARRARRRQ